MYYFVKYQNFIFHYKMHSYTIAYILIIILLAIVVYQLYTKDNKSLFKKSIFKKQIITEKYDFIVQYLGIMNNLINDIDKEFPAVVDITTRIRKRLIKASEILSTSEDYNAAFQQIYLAYPDLNTVFNYILQFKNIKYQQKYMCTFVNKTYDLITSVDFGSYENDVWYVLFLTKELIIYDYYFTYADNEEKRRAISVYNEFINKLMANYIRSGGDSPTFGL